MDDADSQWAVVNDGATPSGWLPRSAATGDGVAADRVEPAPTTELGSSLDHALAAILAGNAPGAIVTDGGRYAGVLAATDIVAAARAR
jgi:hypothetical protein